MEFALILSRLALTATFLVAGLAKLADRSGTRTAIVGFGASKSVARPLAIVIPVAELAAAIALFAGSWARWGAIGALVLLAAFTVAIAANLVRGKKPDCRCFGQLKPTPIGSGTVVRNGGLAVLAVFVAGSGWHRGYSITGALSGLSTGAQVGLAVGLVLAAAVAFQGCVLLGMFGQMGRLLVRVETAEAALERGAAASPLLAGLPVGELAPDFSLPNLDGDTVTFEQLRSPGRPVMLVFTDPDCGGCRDLLPEVAAWHADESSPFAVALISRDGATYDRRGGLPVLVESGDEVSRSFRVMGTPSAVVVRADGIVAAPLVAGADAIRELVGNMKGEPCAAPGPNGTGQTLNRPILALPRSPKVGQIAPPVALPSLTGHTIDLGDFRGEEVALLFWSPRCDYCEQILGDLKAVEADPASRGMVFVSTGTVEDNAAMGLRSPVLLDNESSVSASFGADGTPMAVLIDGDGRVASTMVAGAPAVLSLVRSPAVVTASNVHLNGSNIHPNGRVPSA